MVWAIFVSVVIHVIVNKNRLDDVFISSKSLIFVENSSKLQVEKKNSTIDKCGLFGPDDTP